MTAILVLAMLAAFVGVFRPYKALPAWKRWHYGTMAFALFCIIGLTGLIKEPVKGEGQVSEENAKNTKDQGNQKADALALYKDVSAKMAPCDSASTALAEQAKQNDMVAVYRAAVAVENACLGVSSEIRSIDTPDALSSDDDEIRKTLGHCADSATAKWANARTLKGIVDNGAKPSEMVELEDGIKAAQAGTMLCGAGLVGIAMKHGATADDLGISDKAEKPKS